MQLGKLLYTVERGEAVAVYVQPRQRPAVGWAHPRPVSDPAWAIICTHTNGGNHTEGDERLDLVVAQVKVLQLRQPAVRKPMREQPQSAHKQGTGAPEVVDGHKVLPLGVNLHDLRQVCLARQRKGLFHRQLGRHTVPVALVAREFVQSPSDRLRSRPNDTRRTCNEQKPTWVC